MASGDDQEKTEEATQQRREDFRKRGQVAQTRELGSVLLLGTLCLMIYALGGFSVRMVNEIFQKGLGDFIVQARHDLRPQEALLFFSMEAMKFGMPIMLCFLVVGICSTVFQVGILNNEEAMQLKLDRLDPFAGMKRIFSMKSVVEGVKSLIKMSVIAGVIYFMVRGDLVKFPVLSHMGIEGLFAFVFESILGMSAAIAALMATVAGMDYLWQRYDLEQEMKMTKQEIKEENKSREGDPLIKARIRRQQREIANRRMMDSVPKADVIITNPTHIAVALLYNPEKFAAPQIVAMGRGLIAQKIKEIARENGVPIVENKPLARTMFKTMKIGQVVPRELFAAVAQVLAHVFRLKKKARGF